MPRSFACIISDAERERLVAIAAQFAHSIGVIDDGIMFDVSGLERLMGKPDRIAQKILREMQRQSVAGRVAVAGTADSAMLLARSKCTIPPGSKDTCHVSSLPLLTRGLVQPEMFSQLPLADLAIEQDTLNVFNDLGLHRVEDLLAVPHDELINRYGQQFRAVIDTIEQNGVSLLVPNVKEDRVSWSFELDNAVEDFEQLIFMLNHGLERLFEQVAYCGFSTEHLDLAFKLRNKTEKTYEIRTSFPTLERAFWLKLINLRASLDPPEASITCVNVTSHFAKARPTQRGLYAVSRPDPESLLLTVGKLKKLVGEENVGVPVILNQRLAEPFGLDSDATPDVSGNAVGEKRLSRPICGEARFADDGLNSSAAMPPNHSGGIAAENIRLLSEKQSFSANRAAEPPETIWPRGVIAFTFYRLPMPAEVLVRDRQLVYLKTRYFAGHIANVSGVWKANSKWWDRTWRTQEWDIEVETGGVYRLCKVGEEWFLIGEYD